VMSVNVRQLTMEVRDTEYGGILADAMTLARKRDPSGLDERKRGKCSVRDHIWLLVRSNGSERRMCYWQQSPLW
jgi:hypothetical protein